MNEGKFMSAMNKPTVHSEYEREETKNNGSLLSRARQKMGVFKEQYQNYSEDEPIIKKANELLEKYGSADNIPAEELNIDKSGFDDARLLGFVQIIEEDK